MFGLDATAVTGRHTSMKITYVESGNKGYYSEN